MKKYLIAGLKVKMTSLPGGTLETQAKNYLYDFDGEADVVISLKEDFIKQRHLENPHLTLDKCEYIWTCTDFCSKLIAFGGFMLHASAVVFEDKAYLFSASSGTGKSTHTAIWQRVFGEDKTYILNDDKPVIRVSEAGIFVCGTPWSGKTDKNRNLTVPLGGICFLKRGAQNHITEKDPKDAIFSLLNQTLRPDSSNDMSSLLALISGLITKTTIYDMACNMEDEAAIVAYNKMKNSNGNASQKGCE